MCAVSKFKCGILFSLANEDSDLVNESKISLLVHQYEPLTFNIHFSI